MRFAQFTVDPKGDIERDSFFRRTIAPVSTAVLAAMAGIYHDGFESVTGVGGDGRTAGEKKSGPESKGGDKADRTRHVNR